MIGQLRGNLIEKNPPYLLLDIQGVGYLLQAPLSTFFALPQEGEPVTVRVHQIIREDAHLLFGFATKEEWRLFQELIKINGVGPKAALAILSAMSVHSCVEAIEQQQAKILQRVPGIGAKTAQRIIVEMQDKIEKLVLPLAHSMKATPVPMAQLAKQEAILALQALGYKPKEAQNAVEKVKDLAQSCQNILKEALQGLAKI